MHIINIKKLRSLNLLIKCYPNHNVKIDALKYIILMQL